MSGIYLSGNTNDDAGVQRLHTPQSTDAAAAQAIAEQQPGDEFKPYTPPDIQALTVRLNELETECTSLYARLYGPPDKYDYKQPPYMERENLHKEIAKVDEEKDSILYQLREYVDAMGVPQSNPGPYVGEPKT